MEAAAALQRLVEGGELTPAEAAGLMGTILSGEVPEALLGGLLVALRMGGVGPAQLAAFARTLQDAAVGVDTADLDPVDSVGTGGGAPSFNLSTAAAVVAAAAGARVAKHGNRAVTSRCGAADVLESLGLRLSQTPQRHRELLSEVGLTFLFAPDHHPAFRAVGPVRRTLGVRTVFNQMGPLVNPARTRRQVVGVFDPAMVRPMAEAFQHLDSVRALVVCGEDGLDEVSPTGPSRACVVEEGRVREITLTPADFGLEAADPAALVPGESAAENAAILRSAVDGSDPARTACVLPAAAAVLWAAGIAPDFAAAGPLARAAVADGRAAARLDAWIAASNAAPAPEGAA